MLNNVAMLWSAYHCVHGTSCLRTLSCIKRFIPKSARFLLRNLFLWRLGQFYLHNKSEGDLGEICQSYTAQFLPSCTPQTLCMAHTHSRLYWRARLYLHSHFLLLFFVYTNSCMAVLSFYSLPAIATCTLWYYSRYSRYSFKTSVGTPAIHM